MQNELSSYFYFNVLLAIGSTIILTLLIIINERLRLIEQEIANQYQNDFRLN